MSEGASVTSTTIRPATDHGWLRVPDRDGVWSDAWERPDGVTVWMFAGWLPMVLERRTVR
jgi:hypothetical protein